MGDSFQYENAPADVVRCRYDGTATLREGYAMFYDFDRSDTDNDGNTVYYKRAYVVEQGTATNVFYFAGFVAPESDGATGPCEVTLIPPHGRATLAYVWTNENLSAGDLLFGDDTGEWTAKSDGSTDAAATSFPIASVSVANDTSTTAGKTLCWVGQHPAVAARFTAASD